MSAETRSFQAEVQQLLDLMIHSLYTRREVFLRELVSNASDALDRLRFESLTRPELLPNEELQIRLRVDPRARTLSVVDNGIGMSRDEVLENIGTIARSGTAAFLRELRENPRAADSPELIGQFGVGFYASFMVADAVTLLSRKAGESSAVRWHSSGDGSYRIEDAERDAPGTTVTLALKPPDPESGMADYTDEWVLRDVVKRYSDFVSYPIRLEIEGREKPEGGDGPLNSMKAIWTRPESELSEQEHAEFYRHVSHDWHDPLLHLRTKIEGNFEAHALLYVPSVAPFDLYHRETAHRGIQLYVKRVFIMDECRELLPEPLRFVRGVVDAEDLSLNVSREMLQQDRQIRAIRRHLVKRVHEALAELMAEDREKYLGFWAQFGPVLKEGLLRPDEKHDRILDLMLVRTTREEDSLVPLREVVERMPEEQEPIYYLCGPSRELLAASPHLEALRERGVEVLLFTDHVDGVWLSQRPPEYRGKRWQSIEEGEIRLGSEEERRRADEEREQEESGYRELLARVRAVLQDEVKEVRLSRRLTTSPACLVLDEGDLPPQLEQMLRQAGQDVPKTKRVLELNPAHPLLARLRELCEQDREDPRIAECAELLYAQALLAEGGTLPEPAAFGRKVADLMLKTL